MTTWASHPAPQAATGTPGGTRLGLLTDVMWLAGLLEGGGCFQRRTKQHKPHHAISVSRQILLTSTDKDVAQRAAQLLDAKLNGPYEIASGNKPVWRVSLARRDRVREVLFLIFPHLGDRRQQQVLEVLQ